MVSIFGDPWISWDPSKEHIDDYERVTRNETENSTIRRSNRVRDLDFEAGQSLAYFN